jgi:ATP-dependent DNA helicase RecQ
MLLRYFGEKNARDCGICDVCLAKRQKEKLEADTARIIPAILHILAAGEMTVEDVADRTEFPVNHILCAVRFLADSGKIEVNDNRLKIR